MQVWLYIKRSENALCNVLALTAAWLTETTILILWLFFLKCMLKCGMFSNSVTSQVCTEQDDYLVSQNVAGSRRTKKSLINYVIHAENAQDGDR